MKIYFCGSIRGGRGMAGTYEKLIGLLAKYGRVLSEHLGNDEWIESRDRKLTDQEIHDRDMHWLSASDLVVAEVTVPSLGVGYEIGRAIEMGKPVLCLFQPGFENTLSAMIAGSDRVELKQYRNLEEAKDLLKVFFQA